MYFIVNIFISRFQFETLGIFIFVTSPGCLRMRLPLLWWVISGQLLIRGIFTQASSFESKIGVSKVRKWTYKVYSVIAFNHVDFVGTKFW